MPLRRYQVLEVSSHDDVKVLDVYCVAIILDGRRHGDGCFCDGRSAGPAFIQPTH